MNESVSALEQIKRAVEYETPIAYHGYWNFSTELGEPESCLITGPVGTGKSCLAAMLLQRFATLTKTLSVRYKLAWEFLAEIRSSYRGDGMSEIEIVNEWANKKILVMDDLGAEQKTDHAISSMIALFAKRVSNMEITIVTSNLTLAKIDEYEPRLASRLAGFRQIKLTGDDRRLKATDAD